MTKKRIAKNGTTTNNRMTIHLDEGCIRDLQQLKRRIDAQAGEHAPVFSLPALARHAIRKWCDHVAAPIPRPWEQTTSDEAASAED